MKIVRVIARLNVGGPARHVVWLNKGLDDNEFQSILIAGSVPDGEHDMGYFAKQNGIVPIIVEELSREISFNDLISLWKIYRCFVQEKPDIIHTHTAKAGTIGRIAGFAYRWFTPGVFLGKPRQVKCIHTYHGHVFHSYYGKLKTKFFLFVERTLARLVSDSIVVISKQQKIEINEGFKIGKVDQFEIIPLGVDLNLFENNDSARNDMRGEINAEENEILIGIVGRLTEIKNHKLFLQIAKLYQESGKSDFPILRFIIIGDGNLRGYLETIAEEYGVNDIVTFLGNREQASALYAGLDIVALTSLNEGTPLSLIEAMANKKPVISTSIGGVVDLLGEVEAGKEGFDVCERGVTVISEDAEGFYAGLLYLIKNKHLRLRIAEKGKEFVFNNYAKDRLIEDTKELYRELIP